jgi:hypothetical protein
MRAAQMSDQDRFEYIELADGPDDLPDDLIVFDHDGKQITPGHPEWEPVIEYIRQQATPPDPDFSHQSRTDEIKREIFLSGADALQGVTDKSIRDCTVDSILHVLSEQIDPRFEHIATWWDQYAPRKRTASGLTVVRTTPITPTRRGPRPLTDSAWLTERAKLLAWHCEQNAVTDPFILSGETTAKWSCFSDKNDGHSLRNALSERRIPIGRLHGEAWKILGCPSIDTL